MASIPLVGVLEKMVEVTQPESHSELGWKLVEVVSRGLIHQ